MRRSTKGNRRRTNSTAAAASAPSAANAKLVRLPLGNAFHDTLSNGIVICGFPDGLFEIHCTTPDAKVIQGNCQDEKYRLSPRPLSPVPDVLVADCNGDGPSYVLRIYRRTGDGSLIDMTHYSYQHHTHLWDSCKIPSSASQENSSANQGTGNQKTGKRIAFLWQLFSKLFAFLNTLIRLLLWPIADFHWQNKLKKRRFSIQLTPSIEMEMNWDGSLILMGNVLRSVRLFSDGEAIVNNKKLRPNQSGIAIPTDDLIDDDTTQPWIEWYGDMMIIRLGEQYHSVITYENGGWYLTELYDKTILGMIGRDLSLSNQTGRKFLITAFLTTGVAILILIIAVIIREIILSNQEPEDIDQPQQTSESQEEYVPPKPLIP